MAPSGGSLNARQRRWLWTLAALAAAIAIPIGYLATRGLYNELRLSRTGRSICAEVTARRAGIGRNSGPEVKYRFEVDGVVYRSSDETGRQDLWATVRPDEWQRSRTTGCVDIIYRPDAPSVNRPAHSQPMNHPVSNLAAGLVLCLIVLGLAGRAAAGIVKVARTPLWQLGPGDDGVWELTRDSERRRIGIDEVERARLDVLQRRGTPPPWRYDRDVLTLRLERETVVVAADSEACSQLIEQLRLAGKLTRRR